MVLYQIYLPAKAVDLTDADLAKKVRESLQTAIKEREFTMQMARQTVRKKLGTPITIDGIAYDSRAQAAKALKMTRDAFNRRYPR